MDVMSVMFPLLLHFISVMRGNAFLAHTSTTTSHVCTEQRHGSTTTTTILYGAFNKRNKQGDLMKKMQEAKRQREMQEGYDVEEEGSTRSTTKTSSKIRQKSDEEMKRENDMKRFEQLLNSESATINYDVDGKSGNYLTKKQEEEEIDAGCEFISFFCY